MHEKQWKSVLWILEKLFFTNWTYLRHNKDIIHIPFVFTPIPENFGSIYIQKFKISAGKPTLTICFVTIYKFLHARITFSGGVTETWKSLQYVVVRRPGIQFKCPQAGGPQTKVLQTGGPQSAGPKPAFPSPWVPRSGESNCANPYCHDQAALLGQSLSLVLPSV